MPSVTRPVLDDAIARFEHDLCSAIQFQDHLAENDDIEVHGIRSVHARVIGFQDLQSSPQFLLHFFEQSRSGGLLGTGAGGRRQGKHAEPEAVLRWEELRLGRRGAIGRERGH